MINLKLNALQVVNANQRISSIGAFRGLAIICVVLFHYKISLPYGYLAVLLA